MSITTKYLQLLLFARRLGRYRWMIGAVVAGRVTNAAIGMIPPLAMRYLIDQVAPHRDWTGFMWVCVMLAGVMLASLAASAFVSFVGTRLEQRITFDLKVDIQKKWERLPVAYFQAWGVGEHIYRCTTDVHNVAGGLSRILPELAVAHVNFIFFLIVSATLNFRLTFWFLLSLPLLITVEVFHSRALRPVQASSQTLSAEANDTIGQYASGIVAMKIFVREKLASRRYVGQLSRLVRLAFDRWGIDTRFQILSWLVGPVWGWAVVLYGFGLIMRGELTIGTLVALKLYLTAMTRPVQELGTLIQSVVLGSVSAERLRHTLEAPEEPLRTTPSVPAAPQPWAGGVAIAFHDVSFGYDPESPVLTNVTATLPRTGLIGLSGCSGAGKTTLVSLIARLYEPASGHITFDARDIRQIGTRDVRRFVSMVPQETRLFPGTIEDNIAFGNHRATHEDIVRAARAAQAHDFIVQLKDGYRSRITGSGSGLSQGQRQRIGIARAFLKDAPILVLDEGLNSVDEALRSKLFDTIADLASRRTVLFITHDLEYLNKCDRVFEVCDRMVIERTRPAAVLPFVAHSVGASR